MLNRLSCSTLALNYQSIQRQSTAVKFIYSCAVTVLFVNAVNGKILKNIQQTDTTAGQSLKVIVQVEVEAMTSQPAGSQPVTTLARPALVSLYVTRA